MRGRPTEIGRSRGVHLAGLALAVAAAVGGRPVRAEEAAPPSGDVAAEVARLREEVKRLQEVVQAQAQAQKPPPAADAQAAPPPKPSPPPAPVAALPVKADGFAWEVGGYAKLDAVFRSRAIGGGSIADQIYIASAVPAPGQENHLKLSARETRIWFRSAGPTPLGDFRVFIEGDFFGVSSALESVLNLNDFSIREAYGQIGPLMAGQAWTTFQNLAASPPATTLGTLPGQVFVRQPQVRWTQPLGRDGSGLSVALENPETVARWTDPAQAAVSLDQESFPDLVVRGDYRRPGLSLSLAGLARVLSCDHAARTPCSDGAHRVLGAGVSAAGRVDVAGRSNARFQATWGSGTSRYVSSGPFPDAMFDDAGGLHPVRTLALLVSYQHFWTDTVATAVIYDYSRADGVEVNPRSISALHTANANVTWSPVPRVILGLEYLYARWEIADGSVASFHSGISTARYMF